MDDADIAALRKIQKAGVNIVAQRIPTESPVDVMKLIDKM